MNSKLPQPLDLDQDGTINGVPYTKLKMALGNAKPRRDGKTIKAVYWIAEEGVDEGFLVRKPSIDEADPFTAAAISQDGTKINTATRNLVKACVIYPEHAELLEILDDNPFLALSLVGKINELAGGARGFELKKS